MSTTTECRIDQLGCVLHGFRDPECKFFNYEHEPPAPRAGERDEWRVMNFTKDGANEWMVVTGIGRTVALANTSDARQAEREMRQIATEHNQINAARERGAKWSIEEWRQWQRTL